ncbi:MAG: hypothetical protein JJU20_03730 [Opitutales bacterium]|nr:hypothetical protein [Opitutales bacterium]
MVYSEYLSLGLYFIFLIVIGILFSRFNRNLSDYVRGGGMATWWMVGTSSLMAAISAFTFTGNASAAYEAGPTLLIIYAANCAGFLIGFFFLAAWFRQTRALTLADIIRERFGVAAEQFNVISFAFLAPVAAAIQLWALAVFASAVFGFPLIGSILVIGAVVTIYSTTGGRWGVMATDFLQSLILIPITLLLGYLSLRAVGGFSGLIEIFSMPGISEDFRFVKEPGAFSDDRFTPKWIVAIFLIQLSGFISISGAPRYLSVKDGREGRRSAMLAFVLMAIGAFVWIIPPMVARAKLAEEVAAVGLENVSEASYAVAAMAYLPNGLLGVMIVAMFAATMSSMDTGLNMVTGTVVRNFWPWVQRITGLKPMSPSTELLSCKLVTAGLGVAITGMALMLAAQRSFQLFDAYFVIATIIGLPVTIPLVAGLFIRRLPYVSYFIISILSALPAIYSLLDARFNGNNWTVQDRALWVIAFGLIGVLISVFLKSWEKPENRSQIEALFRRMKTPVDPSEHEGLGTDSVQLITTGKTTVSAGVFLLLLLLLVESLQGVLAVLFVSGFVLCVGALMLWAGRRSAVGKFNKNPEES